MKRLLIWGIISLLTICSAWSQNSIFKSLQKYDDVEFIQLDKSMLTAAFQASAPGQDISATTNLIEGLTVIIVDKDNKKASKKAHSIILKKIVPEYTLKVSMEDKDLKSFIYAKELADGLNEYVTYTEEEDDIVIAVMKGKMSSKEAKEMIKIDFKKK